jgi:3-hydroxyisobutyrate dehydrogenase
MNTTSDTLRVGFIGLGSQGGPMARRIIEAGYPVTLWARRPGTLARVGEHGAALLAVAAAALALMNVSR